MTLQLRLADSPDRMSELAELTADLAAANEEIEELRHNLAQAKINNDISQNEVLAIANNLMIASFAEEKCILVYSSQPEIKAQHPTQLYSTSRTTL